MRRRLSIFLVVGMLMTASASAQHLYSLLECKQMALEHNAKMKIASNKTLMAKQEKKEAFTNFLPTISLNGGGMKANEGLMQMQMAPQNIELIDKGLFGSVNASLPLFAGGRIINGNKLAKIGEEVSVLQLNQTENEVLLTVEQYYWQIVVLTEKLHTIQKVEEMLDRIGKDVEVSVNAGLKNRNDLLQVNLRKNNTQSNKINLESALALSKDVLGQYIGIGSQSFSVSTTLQAVPVSPLHFKTNHSEALSMTTEYQLLNKNVEAAKLQKRMTLGEYLPSVALGGAYLYQDLMGPSQNSVVGFISVSVPISWKAPYSVKKQKYNLQNAQTQYTDGSERLLIRMQKTWTDFKDAYEQVLLAQESITQAMENLRLNEDYYKAGTTSMSELLDAQVLYQQSQDKYAEMMGNYEIKKLEYLQATGRYPTEK